MSAKAYKKHISDPSSVSEPAMPYGDINALKVQLVNRIMRMDEAQDVSVVLDFVKKQTGWEEQFEEDWERSLSAEDFRILCKKRLKDIYAND